MNISYDSKSFIVDGNREWLFLAEIHYFRFPKEEWRRIIKMAKAAGVNTIATYLAWNYHEPEEGKFDFSGDHSFADFIDIAKEEGMFVFVRPGPYICAEWSGGGIPSWILNYEELELRVDEETFMRCAENWYKEALNFIVPDFCVFVKVKYSVPMAKCARSTSESVETFNISPALKLYVNKFEKLSATYVPIISSSTSYHWNVAAGLLKSTIKQFSAEGCCVKAFLAI